MQKLIKLHPLDNVQILVEEINAGEALIINEMIVYFDKPVKIGHKIAERFIAAGEKVIKYGVPIGSSLMDIAIGTHIHLNNMKSDYIPTYTLDKGFKEDAK